MLFPVCSRSSWHCAGLNPRLRGREKEDPSSRYPYPHRGLLAAFLVMASEGFYVALRRHSLSLVIADSGLSGRCIQSGDGHRMVGIAPLRAQGMPDRVTLCSSGAQDNPQRRQR